MATQRETMALNGVPGSVLGDEERSDEAPSTGAQTPRVVPDPEVVAKPTRRQFSAAYRLRIIEEADRCTEPGELGRLLRREGLYTPTCRAGERHDGRARWRGWPRRSAVRSPRRAIRWRGRCANSRRRSHGWRKTLRKRTRYWKCRETSQDRRGLPGARETLVQA